MNKHDLIRKVASLTGEKIGTVELVLATIDEVVRKNAAKKEETNLGFAKVKTAEKAARVARNPRTGVEAEVPARTAVKFTAHKSLKDAANSANRSVK